MMDLETRMELEARFYLDVSVELVRARNKFPEGRHRLAAMMEEFGEVANAILERNYLTDASVRAVDHDCHVWDECVQAAVMAMRLAVEGDPEFQYEPPRDKVEG